MLNYCSNVNVLLYFLKDFVREKTELTRYAQLTRFILVGSSKALCISMSIFMYIKNIFYHKWYIIPELSDIKLLKIR